MSAEITTYRAKVQCHIGGLYRRAGDEFTLPTLKDVPGHLEVVKPVADDSKVEKADLGIGEVKSASDVTSSDMLNK